MPINQTTIVKKTIAIIGLLFIAGVQVTIGQSKTTAFEVDGIKVIYRQIPKNILNVQLYFRGGGVAGYPAAQAGIANFAFSATTECGTKKYDANTFKDMADQYGLFVTGAANADFGVIKLNCITKYFNQGWDLFTEAILNPVFDPAQVALLKTKLISKSKNEQVQPASRVEELLMQNAFAGTPYTTNPAGSQETLSPLTAADLQTYYTGVLNKKQLFIVVVGNISKEEITDKIHAAFGNLPVMEYKPLTYKAPVWTDNKLTTESRQIATNYIAGAANCPSITSPDYASFQLGVALLSGQLFLQLRTRLNLSYDPGARVIDGLMPYCLFHVSTNDPKQAVGEMVEVIKRSKMLNFPDRVLNRLKNNFITSNYMTQQSTSEIANELGEAEIEGGWEFDDTFPDQVAAVTVDKIDLALTKFLLGVRWSYLGNTELAAHAADEFKAPIN